VIPNPSLLSAFPVHIVTMWFVYRLWFLFLSHSFIFCFGFSFRIVLVTLVQVSHCVSPHPSFAQLSKRIPKSTVVVYFFFFFDRIVDSEVVCLLRVSSVQLNVAFLSLILSIQAHGFC
jgi:hypothetical protein